MLYAILLPMLLLPAPGNAGLPSDDPEVARLRADFLAATTPEPAQLRAGSTWKCRGFNAVKGHDERYEGPDYRFEERQARDGERYFLELGSYEMVQNHQVDANQISFIYRFGSGHFMGNPYEDASVTRVHTYLRHSADGRLLVEIASYLYPDLPEPVRSKRTESTEPATLYPELRLMGYEECRLAPAP